jgi:hypothetical protein
VAFFCCFPLLYRLEWYFYEINSVAMKKKVVFFKFLK